MAETIGTIIALILTLIFFASPIIITVIIVVAVMNKKKKKAEQQKVIYKRPNNENLEKQRENVKTYFEEIYNEQEKILFEEDKEEIDEYYDNQYIPYRQKYLLTKNEWNFYKDLREIANKKNLTVLAKIRMADLVEVEPMNKNNWKIYFNKISRKHIDFALARPENLKIVLLIELDDYSHNEKQYERDRFIEAVYKKTGYKLLRVRNTTNLKEKIEETLKQ